MVLSIRELENIVTIDKDGFPVFKRAITREEIASIIPTDLNIAIIDLESAISTVTSPEVLPAIMSSCLPEK